MDDFSAMLVGLLALFGFCYALTKMERSIKTDFYRDRWKLEIGSFKAGMRRKDDGDSATVVLIDSGIHSSVRSAYSDRMAPKEYEAFFKDGAIASAPSMLVQKNSHGTLMAQTILETSKTVTLLAYRVDDSIRGAPESSSVAAAINHAVDAKTDPSSPDMLKDIRVINLSLGSYLYDPDEHAAVKRALENGILVVAGAGNNHTSRLLFPAAFPETLCVSAMTTPVDEGPQGKRVLSEYSNFGEQVDISAPGDYIGGESFGTSHSCAIVSGAAGHLFSLAMDATPEQIATLILRTARDYGEPGYDVKFGHGTLDLAAAVNAMEDPDWRDAEPLWPPTRVVDSGALAAYQEYFAELEKSGKVMSFAEQSKKWEAEGLCRYCGGWLEAPKQGVLGEMTGRRCLSCGKKND